jgi:ABC-type lipoprotein release transport system permease subunit
MDTLIKIAWRNLWRNRRRTILTAVSVVIALSLSLFMRSMQFGSYDQMIEAGVNQVGYLQIHAKGYWKDKSIDKAFFGNDRIDTILKSTKGISLTLRELQTFSLASFGNQTKGVLVSGINPQKENLKTKIASKIIKGNYISNENSSVIIGDKLAEFLKISVGDSLVLIGQGFRGVTAYGLYNVSGIFHLSSLEMNSQLVYMNLQDAQYFVYPYQPGLLTAISIFVNNPSDIDQIQTSIEKKLGNHFEVISWKTMLSEMLQGIELDDVSGQLMLFVLYLIAAFGIFSTILMMTMEKRKQFAVMISIGMQRSKLIFVSMVETFIVSILGIIAALIIISPILIYLHLNPIAITGDLAAMYEQYNIEPILPFSIKPQIFISQTLIILVLSLLSGLYPIIYISRFNVLKAFRH